MNAPTRPGFGKRQQGPQNPGVSANIKDASLPEIRLPPFPILPRHVQAAIHGAAYPIYEEFRHTWEKSKERRNIDSKSYVLEALKMSGLSIHDSGSEVPTHTTLTANPPATGDGPATDDPTTHSPEKDDGPDYKMLEKRIGTVLLKLEKYQGQHISKKRLQKFDITLTNMDFYTGQVDGTHTTQYLVPYPWEDVKREVEICKPPYLDYDEIPVNGRIEDLDSEPEGLDSIPEVLDTGPENRDRLYGALELWQGFCNFLHRHYLGANDVMERLTDWTAIDVPDSPFFSRYSYMKYNWSLYETYRPCLDPKKATLDPERPHVIGCVTDCALYNENRLLISELTSALWLAFLTAREDRWSSHKFIPITLVSASGRNSRIVQCILNTRTREIHMRKTPVVGFSDGLLASKNERQLYTMLGWVMGKVTADTRVQQVQG